MFSRNKRDPGEGCLDEIARELVRTTHASEGEIEAAAVSPLLYSRIRASIAARQRESESPTAGWLGFVRAARLAVPAMALVTVVFTFVPRLTPLHSTQTDRALPRAQVAATLPEPQAPRILVFAASACALSNNEECAISNNEVLATLFAEEDQEKQR